MDQAEFEQKYGHLGRAKQGSQQKGGQMFGPAAIQRLAPSHCCGKGPLLGALGRLLPILGWLPSYKLGHYLHSDLITGLTVGIMVVPQGMAYATLAKVAPVYGLYSCFFAALFYMFFGTSPHISIGTFAVASMMVGNVRSELVPDPPGTNGLLNGTISMAAEFKGPVDFGYPVSPIMLTSALTFGVGLCQLLMALCRLSFLTNYISDPLVSGFTTGAAVHVLTSQIDKLVGVKASGHHGPGMILFMWRDLVPKLVEANPWTLCISAVGLTFLSLGRDYLNPWFRRRFRIPFPLELFLVIAAIIVSMLLGFKQNYGVRVVDHVPDGMPLPSLPHVDLLAHMWLNVLTISIVSYIFVFSLSKIFAKKHKYRVDPNQELCALGLCSLLASFFPVYPFGASLSRSSLCEMTGAKTPLHALFSSALLLVVILWIGPLLEPLPMAILGCIVVVSLKPLFLQFKELPRLWRISPFDFAIWLVAFTTTAFLDITYGLAISVLFSIFTVVLKEQWPNFDQQGEAGEGGLFRPIQLYTGLIDPKCRGQNVQIWRFESALHFANAPRLVELLAEICQQIASGPMAVRVEGRRKELHQPGKCHELNRRDSQTGLQNGDCASRETANPLLMEPRLVARSIELAQNGSGQVQVGQNGSDMAKRPGPKGVLVLDCSAISHIDSVGVDSLVEMHKDALKLDVALKFAAFSDSLLAVFHRCGLFQHIPEQNFFPSPQQALAAIASESA